MSAESTPAPVRLPRGNPVALFAAGRQALREVPGLRGLLVKGFVLLYAISFLVGLAGVGGLYLYVVQPLFQSIEHMSAGEGFWMGLLASLLEGLVWFAEFLLMAGTVAVSFLIAVSLMSVWFEAVAARIIAHRRGQVEQRPFRFGTWFACLGLSLADSIWLIVLAVVALALGFVPIVGPVLVVIVESYLLGREVRDPYLTVRADLGEEAGALRRGLAFWTILTGLVPFVLAMVPVLGWALLPAAMTYLVAGFAWQGEAARAGGR